MNLSLHCHACNAPVQPRDAHLIRGDPKGHTCLGIHCCNYLQALLYLMSSNEHWANVTVELAYTPDDLTYGPN